VPANVIAAPTLVTKKCRRDDKSMEAPLILISKMVFIYKAS